MKVLTILCALLFFSGLVFAEENMKIQQVQLELKEAIDFNNDDRKITVAKETTRAPAVIEYQIANHTADVKYWILKI